MKDYELTYLIQSETSREEISAFSQKINSFIENQKGIIEKNSEEQPRTLGYPIQDKKNVFLKTVLFKHSPDKLLELDKYLKEEKSILRYFLIKIEEKKKKKKKRSRSLDKIDALVEEQKMEKRIQQKTEKTEGVPKIKKEATIIEETPSFIVNAEPKEKKVELKDIDKKLEEILEE